MYGQVCQGSILAGQHSVWFSNPANKAARADFTVRKSKDDAKTWGQSKLVSAAAGCGYSSLQFLEAATERVDRRFPVGGGPAVHDPICARHTGVTTTVK